jgi:signal transduction histidine kinase
VLRLTVMQAEKPPEHIRAELAKLEEIARKTVSQLRSMMFTLRPVALESKGLNAALEQLAEKTDAIYDQKVDILVSPDAENVLSDQQSETVFSIVNEAVNNARKHAKADLIKVRITRYEDEVIVEVIDNGVGFDIEAMEAAYVNRKDQSLGWKNLHEAAERIEGHLKVDSNPGEGTSIVIWVPLDPAGKNLKAQNNRIQKSQSKKKQAKEEKIDSFKLTPMR